MLAVDSTRTGYQNVLSLIMLGGAPDKVAAAISKEVSSAGVMCLQVVVGDVLESAINYGVVGWK